MFCWDGAHSACTPVANDVLSAAWLTHVNLLFATTGQSLTSNVRCLALALHICLFELMLHFIKGVNRLPVANDLPISCLALTSHLQLLINT